LGGKSDIALQIVHASGACPVSKVECDYYTFESNDDLQEKQTQFATCCLLNSLNYSGGDAPFSVNPLDGLEKNFVEYCFQFSIGM